jgi:methylated-DNA-[protein]-cysteine S-methyltransferase
MISALYESPVGALALVSNGAAITQLTFEQHRHAFPLAPAGADPVIDQARRELDLYFAGKLKAFTVAAAPKGTAFQQRVWAALRAIPYGVTRTYAQQAASIGAPRASRAVGAANGRNPVSIIIPCHRVVGASGALTGYAGGMERKQFLLALEQGQPALGC